MKNSVENITICKQTYQNFYNQNTEYLTNTIRNSPAYEINEIISFKIMQGSQALKN